MTKPAICGWCGDGIVATPTGRPRRYCRRSHRQRAYEARLAAERLGLDRGDALISAEALQSLRERLRAVSGALRDVERDLRRGDADYEGAFRHLYAVTVGLGDLNIEPRAWLQA